MSYVNVLFVVLEKTFYIYAMIVLKTIFTIIGDLFLIPQFGVNGVAYSNIVINIICVALCMIFIFREKLFVVSFRFKTSFLEEYLFIGLFSGSQILLDNLIYSVIVCKMVNEVAEQGNYWVANNIIWGLMLIPMISLFLKNVMGIENHEIIKQILVTLIPFYLAYSYTVLLDNILIGYGKTQYCFIISAVVNLIYYPIVYILMLKGVFTSGMKFICMMFGFGMVSHLGCSILCFIIYIRNSNRKRVLS